MVGSTSRVHSRSAKTVGFEARGLVPSCSREALLLDVTIGARDKQQGPHRRQSLQAPLQVLGVDDPHQSHGRDIMSSLPSADQLLQFRVDRSDADGLTPCAPRF